MMSPAQKQENRSGPGVNSSPRFACENHLHQQSMFVIADNPLVAIRLDPVPIKSNGYTCSTLGCDNDGVWIVRPADPVVFIPLESKES